MTTNNQYSIESLIKYYQNLVVLNTDFTKSNKTNPETDNESKNDNYTNLINKLITIRQLIIDKKASEISKQYKPAPGLFIDKAHFDTLESTIQFYIDNPAIDYQVSNEGEQQQENKQDFKDKLSDKHIAASSRQKPKDNHDNAISITHIQQLIESMDKKINNLEAKLATTNEQIGSLANSEHMQLAAKSASDILAKLDTNFELMKADLSKYDVLLTDHINKSSSTALNAMEKEHARFVLEASAEINAIVRGIREANAPAFAVQNEIMERNAKVYDDKSFKYFCFSFLTSMFAIFGCAILSSHWVAGKVLDNAKVLKISTVCSSSPVASQKHKLRND